MHTLAEVCLTVFRDNHDIFDIFVMLIQESWHNKNKGLFMRRFHKLFENFCQDDVSENIYFVQQSSSSSSSKTRKCNING